MTPREEAINAARDAYDAALAANDAAYPYASLLHPPAAYDEDAYEAAAVDACDAYNTELARIDKEFPQ